MIGLPAPDRRRLLTGAVAFAVLAPSGTRAAEAPTASITGARWFTGTGFEPRTGWSVGGRLTFRRPVKVDQTLDLAGAFLVPPFADAHNHSIATGVEAWDRKAIAAFLAAGVFYVKIQANLPITDAGKRLLGLNSPDGLDVAFAQGPLTAPRGHPAYLDEMVLLPQGYYPGQTPESLVDYCYFPISSVAELNVKWPMIRAQRGDFLKVMLNFSDEFESRKGMPVSGLDPKLLPAVVAKAHAEGLRVTTHIRNTADLMTGVRSGVDEIAHFPAVGILSVDEARLAGARRVTLVTTAALIRRGPPRGALKGYVPEYDAGAIARQGANLKLLHESGALLAVGSDDVTDTSVREVRHLRTLGVFDDAAILRMWCENAPRTVFPKRRIGRLAEGYEASFLALDGDPLVDWEATNRIRLRFKQGRTLL